MNTGQITKSRSNQRFTVVPNEIFNDKSMSLKAIGLLTYLLSLPDNWVIYKSELENHFSDGETSIRTAFKELQEKGYILSVEIRNEKGHFKGYNHHVYDYPIKKEPKRDFPISDNPILDNPILDNQVLLNTNNTNTHSNNKNNINKKDASHLKSDFEVKNLKKEIEKGKRNSLNGQGNEVTVMKAHNGRARGAAEYSEEFEKEFWEVWKKYSTSQYEKKLPTYKHFKKLTKAQRKSAIEKIPTFFKSREKQKHHEIARTYLSDKIFEEPIGLPKPQQPDTTFSIKKPITNF